MPNPEIINGPLELYIAPVGEANPDVDEAPAGNWLKLGTSGDKNYHEDGVSIAHEQTIEEQRVLGSTGPIKAMRTEEGLVVTVQLLDLSPTEYARILNDNAVTSVAPGSGTPGYDHVGLHRGLNVAEMALLIRGENKSPMDLTMAVQWEIPRVYMRSSPTPVFVKGQNAGLEFEFVALEDNTGSTPFGRMVAQDEVEV